MFFTNFFTWLNIQLSTYISSKLAIIGAYLDPVFVAFGVMYVMFWGWLHLTGKIEEPLLEGAKRIFIMACIFWFGLHLWTNHANVVNAVFLGPTALGAAILGAGPPGPIPPSMAIADSIWVKGIDIAGLFWNQAGIWDGNFGFYLGAFAVWIITGLLVVYVAFLLALAKVALAILIAIGPLFIAFIFFDATKRFFEAWIAQLANYAFITILVSLVAALVMRLCDSFAATTLAHGAGIKMVDAFDYLMTVILSFLLMRQVMSMSAGLASGIALSTGNIISGALLRGVAGAASMARGMMDSITPKGRTHRNDSLGRKSGFYAGEAAKLPYRGGRALWRMMRKNSLTKK